MNGAVVVGCDGAADTDPACAFTADEAQLGGDELVVVIAYYRLVDPELADESSDAALPQNARERTGWTCLHRAHAWPGRRGRHRVGDASKCLPSQGDRVCRRVRESTDSARRGPRHVDLDAAVVIPHSTIGECCSDIEADVRVPAAVSTARDLGPPPPLQLRDPLSLSRGHRLLHGDDSSSWGIGSQPPTELGRPAGPSETTP